MFCCKLWEHHLFKWRRVPATIVLAYLPQRFVNLYLLVFFQLCPSYFLTYVWTQYQPFSTYWQTQPTQSLNNGRSVASGLVNTVALYVACHVARTCPCVAQVYMSVALYTLAFHVFVAQVYTNGAQGSLPCVAQAYMNVIGPTLTPPQPHPNPTPLPVCYASVCERSTF